MNEAPVPPYQSDSAPQTPPLPATPVGIPVPVAPRGSQALGTWSLILGISSVVLAILFFIAIPAAIVAIVLGSIVLAKHRPGRGKALAGIITGGMMLLFIPITLVTLVAYNGITQRANDIKKTSLQQDAKRVTVASSDGSTVNTSCYNYAVPNGEIYDNASTHCTTAVNISGGDALTRVTVKGNTGTIGSLQDVVTAFNSVLQKGDTSKPGVIDKQQLIINGRTAYFISYKDAYGLLFGNYIIPDASATQVDATGKTIVGYTVAGYVYNSQLKSVVTGVVESLTLH